jgi:general L-amino acid transport system permease protein
MADTFYVRRQMLPAEPAPRTVVGPVGWMRANLFSGWFNSILTLVCIAVVYFIITHLYPWFAHSVWNANSLKECRTIITERYGEGASGACFAVIHQRWKQFLFGFYPAELYWRPTLAFFLMLVALAPVLFQNLPRKMLWFSVLFPGIAYWLLWGGSIFIPIGVYFGFVVAVVVRNLVMDRSNRLVGLIAGVIAALIWWFYLDGPVTNLLARALPFLSMTEVASKQFGGFMLSVVIGMTGITFSLPLGILLALGRRSKMIFVKSICVGFIEFIRGVPLITLLLVASFLLNIFLPPGTNFDIILRVIIMVTLFSAAYMAEIIRGGLAALPKGQYEAADALGLDYWQAMRLIIMPQALKISIPNIVNNFISLFKDTTLVAIIALLDPIGLVTSIRSDSNWNGIVWELYGFVALIFFVCCYSMSLYSKYLERKLRTDHR